MITVGEFVGGVRWSISQPFGQTPWSLGPGFLMYQYGVHYCLAPGTHPGVDIGVPIGTRLYSPVAGRVIIAGGTAVFTDQRFGNTAQTGQLKIETLEGHHVIIGHMERIEVWKGQQVGEGQFIGRSGTNNGPHVHVECRVPSGACNAGYKCVEPMDVVFDRVRNSEPIRLFRVTVDFLTIYDQATMNSHSAGQYRLGEVAPCNVVIRGQEVRPGEAAWGRITGGEFAGKWVYLGDTREVRPGQDDIRYFVVLTDFRNVRKAPHSQDAPLGQYQRGDVIPIAVIVEGEEVEPGQATWGQIAYGPFERQWVYLGGGWSHEIT